MAREFKQGDRVEWNTPQGKTRGTVGKKLISSTEVGGQKVNASEDDPRYVIEMGFLRLAGRLDCALWLCKHRSS